MVSQAFELIQVLDRDVEHLSGALLCQLRCAVPACVSAAWQHAAQCPLTPLQCPQTATPQHTGLASATQAGSGRGISDTDLQARVKLHRFAIAAMAVQAANVYILDQAVCCRRSAAGLAGQPGDRQAAVLIKQVLAGGELQRFAIAVVAAQQAAVCMVDEPFSWHCAPWKAGHVRTAEGGRS